MPPRENAQDKARRYLAEGRLRVLYVKPGDNRIRAVCRGDGETWKLGYSSPPAPARWFCGCPAKTTDCAHLLALRLVCQSDVGVPFSWRSRRDRLVV